MKLIVFIISIFLTCSLFFVGNTRGVFAQEGPACSIFCSGFFDSSGHCDNCWVNDQCVYSTTFTRNNIDYQCDVDCYSFADGTNGCTWSTSEINPPPPPPGATATPTTPPSGAGCTITNNSGANTFIQNSSGSFSTTPVGGAVLSALIYIPPGSTTPLALCTNPQIPGWNSCPNTIVFTQLGYYTLGCAAYDFGGEICRAGSGNCQATVVAVVPQFSPTPTTIPSPTPTFPPGITPTATPTLPAGFTPTPTITPPVVSKTITGVVFVDENKNGIQDAGPETLCYEGNARIVAVPIGGGTSGTTAPSPFESHSNCNQYTIVVPAGKTYGVSITPVHSDVSVTGWNTGCGNNTCAHVVGADATVIATVSF